MYGLQRYLRNANKARRIQLGLGDGMGRKATIVISLVDESCEKTPDEIRDEILRELSKDCARIPWCKKIEGVRVT